MSFDFNERPLLGISACLLGKKVRFDGGHKNNKYVQTLVTEHVVAVPVCPEAEIGLGVPRPPIQLRKMNGKVRLVVSKTIDLDLTEKMHDYSVRKATDLGGLDGFVFKKDSPSCGVFRVPVVVGENGARSRDGVGAFAKVFTDRYPLIPVEEEGRLNDPVLRENFLGRVYSYRRWKEMLNHKNTVNGLVQFHSQHKFMLMVRGSSYYSELGRLVANTKTSDLAENQKIYIHRFMQIMSKPTRRGQHVNVMHHAMGYMKKRMEREDKRELLAIIDAYRKETVPLITPLTLLRHHARKHSCGYLISQYYFEPYPASLALRSSL